MSEGTDDAVAGAGGGVAGDGAAAEPKNEPKAAPEGEASALAGALAAKSEGAGDAKADPKEGADPKKDVAPPAADAKDEAPKDVDGNAVPETYEINMPDGVEMNKELLAEVTPLFREAKLSPAQAQVVADAYVKTQRDAIDAHAKQVADWRKETKADPEIGGKDHEKHLADAHRGFKAFGNERALQIIDHYGLGDHPDILRVFARVGKAIGEGSTILSGGTGERQSAARDMYPDMYKS